MRKILTVLLAVMMLASVLATLPASAATYDGSTAASVGKPELIITEMAQNSGENGSTGFIEVFNNTTADVDFSTLSLLRALNFNMGLDEYDPMYPYVENWVCDKLFLQKMDIVSGEIIKNPSDYYIFDSASMTKVCESLENSADDLTVASGETAIIWFVTEQTAEWLYSERAMNIAAYDPREIFIKTYLGTDARASDYNIIMVWACSNWDWYDELTTDMFTWDIPATTEYNKSVIIALAENTWDLANDNCKTVNSKIKSMVVIGNLVADYVASSANTSAVFAPATTKPLLKNEKNKVIGNDTVYNDYVEAGYSTSYLEVGTVLWGTAQTPGSLPDWQYAMIKDALNVALPAGLDTYAALNAFFVSEGLGELETGREEEKKEHNYVSREELENLFTPSMPTHTHEYSSDCDTVCNTCNSYREPLVPHTYETTCDTDCDMCGKTRTVTHTYQSFCDTSCDVCSETRTVNDKYHLYSAGCDTDCNRCGHVREASNHVYRTACDNTCLICGFVREVEGHLYDHACDAICNACGFEREVVGHTFDNDCDITCNNCPLQRLEKPHIFTAICDTDCQICGFTRKTDNHTYDHNCDTTCNACGFTREALNHAYDHVCDDTCNICGTVRVIAGHTFDNQCDTTCNTCPFTRQANPHIYISDKDIDCNICGLEREIAAVATTTTPTSPEVNTEVQSSTPTSNTAPSDAMPVAEHTPSYNTRTAAYILLFVLCLTPCAIVTAFILRKRRT